MRNLFLVAMLACAFAARAGDGPSVPPIEYDTPQAALSALQAKPGVTIVEREGWTIATDPATHAIWSFAPTTHPAFPAVARRTPVSYGGKVYMTTQLLCGASRQACEQLVLDFRALDKRMREAIEAEKGNAPPQRPAPAAQ